MKDTYEIVKDICLKHGFILESDEKHILNMKTTKEKIDVRCIKHPDIAMNRPYADVKSGRAKCQECSKSNKKCNYTIEKKISLLKKTWI